MTLSERKKLIPKTLISGYCSEMGIDDIEFNENTFSLESHLESISDIDCRKIILMEILVVVYTDSIMHPVEKKIIDAMVDTWDINSRLVTVYGEWSKSFLNTYPFKCNSIDIEIKIDK